jgi:predicted PurR-regulated permease PerM
MENTRMALKKPGDWSLLAVLAVVLYLCYRILQPFLLPIFIALILASLLAPVYHILEKRLKGHRSIAAFAVCLALTVVILLPVILLSVSLTNEAVDVYQRLRDPDTIFKIQTWVNNTANPLLNRIAGWLPGSIPLELPQIGQRLSAGAERAGVAVVGAATSLAAGIFGVLVDYFIMTVVLFFLLRDFDYFARNVRLVSPLSDEQELLFVHRFRVVTQAIVLGNLATALAQGTISGLIFLFLGLSNPLLWGALTALLSLVPMVGTALIWVPWTIYLFATGSTLKAIIFVVVQLVIVGGVDNVLRPLLIEGGVKMHTLLVFFSIVGGIAYFGILGMFFGPLIFAIAMTLLEFFILPRAVAAKQVSLENG